MTATPRPSPDLFPRRSTTEPKVRARFGEHAESTGRRGRPNPARRERTQAARKTQAAELSRLIRDLDVRPADVARLIGCDKSTMTNYLGARRSTPQWVMDSIRSLAANPVRARLSTVMSEEQWQALRADVVIADEEPSVELCLHDYPDDPDRLCDETADGGDGLCAGHREVSVAA